jgi:hypothetical protein
MIRALKPQSQFGQFSAKPDEAPKSKSEEFIES